jgi:hypothetical protein
MRVLRRDLVSVGVVLAIIGVVILLLGIVKVPYTSSDLVEVEKSHDWLNESFTVSALSRHNYYGTFSSGVTLHITFHSGDIDFRVMDEVNYWKMVAGQAYEYYTTPSRSRVTSVNIQWTPPSGQRVYFVWDNTFSWFTSKSVSAYFYYTWTELENQTTTTNIPLLPTWLSYFGVLLLLGGLAIVGYGFVSKLPAQTQPPQPPPSFGT